MKKPLSKQPIPAGHGLNYKYSGQLYCSWECAEAAHGEVTAKLLPLYERIQLVVCHECARCKELIGPPSEILKRKQSLETPTPPPLPRLE